MIAREGLLPVAAACVAGFIVMRIAEPPLVAAAWLLCLAIVVVYRDPQRAVPANPLGVVSPADGRVAAVAEVRDPYLERRSLRISVNMNHWGTFATRSPVEGKALEPPNIPRGKGAPRGVWLQTDEGDDVVMVMYRGRLNNIPRCYIGFGERVGQGQRCGFIHFGSRVDLYLPSSSQALVRQGERIHGGADVIARLNHE